MEKGLNQAEELLNSGEYNEALMILKKYEEKAELNDSDRLSCHLLQSSVFKCLGNYQESFTYGEKAYIESKDLESSLSIIDAIVIIVILEVRHWLQTLNTYLRRSG